MYYPIDNAWPGVYVTTMANESPITEFLTRHGRTQKWLAEQLGMSEAALSRKLGGTRPWYLDEAKKAAEILRGLGKGGPKVEAF